MKILIVYDVSYPSVIGGGQRRLYEVAHRLAKSGHQIDWVCFKTWDTPDKELNADGIKYIGFPGFKGLYNENGSRRKLEPLEFLRGLRRKKIDYSQYDIVWSGQWPLIHLIDWRLNLKAFGKAKIVVDWWEVWGRTWLTYSKTVGLLGFCVEKIVLKIMSSTGHLVTVSDSGFKKCQATIKSNNITLIHNGINSKIEESRVNIQDRENDFVFLGRLKNHKNVNLLISAIKILKSKHNRTINGVVIGDGPELTNLKKLAIEEKVDHQIDFCGEISDNTSVALQIENSKLQVNPSTKEGGGSITMLESYAAGTPVVIFKHLDGIDPELLFNETCGYLANEVSAECLADVMEGALSSTEILNVKSSAAKHKSLDFDWDSIAKKYEKLFYKLSNQKKSFQNE